MAPLGVTGVALLGVARPTLLAVPEARTEFALGRRPVVAASQLARVAGEMTGVALLGVARPTLLAVPEARTELALGRRPVVAASQLARVPGEMNVRVAPTAYFVGRV